MRGLLGNLARAVTPVRRSARKRAGARHQRGLEEMLEEAGFAYGGWVGKEGPGRAGRKACLGGIAVACLFKLAEVPNHLRLKGVWHMWCNFVQSLLIVFPVAFHV
jgi:hypothetical protein